MRYTPDKGALEKTEVTSLQEYTHHMLKLKAMRVRMLRAHDSSSPSSSSSDNDLDHYDCNMCGCVVKDRPHSDVCAKCDLVRKQQRKKVKSEVTDPPKLEKVDVNYNHRQEMFDKIKQTVREERQAATTTTTPKNVSVATSSDCVLGRVLHDLFTPSARRTLEMTKLPKPTSSSEIARSANQLVADVGKFDGDVSVAPRWLHEFCSGIHRYGFDVPNSLYIITKCFIGEAKAWLDQMLDKVSLLAESEDTATRPIEGLLILFKQQYMGPSQISMWKKQLGATKLTSTATTVTDLKLHYKTFVTIINNLRLCDKFLSEEEYRTMYMDALPYSVSLYIGRDYQKFTTLDEIFQVATEAIMKQNQREKKPADGSLAPRKEAINMYRVEENMNEYIPFHAAPTTRKQFDPKDQWNKINTARITCFHCGKTGHFAFDCRLLTEPQTALGAAAYANHNARRGSNVPYDAAKYKQKRETTSSSSSSSHTAAIASGPSSQGPKRKHLFKQGQKPTAQANKEKSKDVREVEEVESDG